MKLRNKKTGEVWETPKMREVVVCQEDDIAFYARLGADGRLFGYKSLAELNEEWEDYKPKEPLIKNEDAQKAVRAWAQHWEINLVKVKLYRDVSVGLIGRDQSSTKGREIDIDGAYVSDDLKNGEEYTIDELCGEEEECES